jgi:hypothetical protein
MPALTSLSGRVLNVFGVGNTSRIQDVFSTTLYTGNGGTQTVTNNVDLGNGGLVWIKSRSASTGHRFTDTVRGVTKSLDSDTNSGEATESTGLTNFSASGFTIGADTDYNTNADTYVSWTFRKQPKFFDIVTYTGTGVNRTVPHNLGSVPGCIIVKRLDATLGSWQVFHRSLSNLQYLTLDTTDNVTSDTTRWNNTAPTEAVFSLGTDATVNANGVTYVAYLFAHNSGGFGTNGSDNAITCGTYLGSNHRNLEVVELGYEPQWVMTKNITTVGQRWVIVDNMRNMTNTGPNRWLIGNSGAAEITLTVDQVVAASNGFYFNGPESDINEAGSTFIYIAIRRPS